MSEQAFNKRIGLYLAQLRREANLEVQDVARLSPISISTLQSYELGLASPSAQTFFQMLKIYRADQVRTSQALLEAQSFLNH